jgi:hypothetical protein
VRTAQEQWDSVRVVAAPVGLAAAVGAACLWRAPRVSGPGSHRSHATLVPWTGPMIRHASHRIERVGLIQGSAAMTATRLAARGHRARGPPLVASSPRRSTSMSRFQPSRTFRHRLGERA